MLINAAGKVWIGRRADADPKRQKYGSWWQMPQGGIDDGEDTRQAALRELQEETGITAAEIISETDDWLTYDLPPELQGKAWKGRYRGQKQKWFLMRFTGADSDIDLDQGPGGHPEFDAWKWAEMDELIELIVPFKRAVYDKVITEFCRFADNSVK